MSIDEDEQAETPAVQVARTALAAAPMDATSEQLDALIRRTATVTAPVRRAIVEEEVRRRANRQEDHVQAGMMGEPVPNGQSREATPLGNPALAQKVSTPEPETKAPEPGSYEDEMAVYKQAREAALARGVNPQDKEAWWAALVEEEEERLAARAGRPPEAAPSPAGVAELVAAKVAEPESKPAEVAQQSTGTPRARREAGRPSPHNRNTSRQNALQLLTVLVVATGIAAWFYHSHEAKRHAAEAVEAAAAAREQQARSIVARVRNSWNADDNWEDSFSSKGAAYTPYTIELESALMKGRPIIAFGDLEDVHNSGVRDNSIVLLQGNGRTTAIDLRFSLLSAPAITKAILNDEDRRSDTFVIAATITSVEKVSMPSDKSDNDQDYFLAHGILHEAQPIGLFVQPPNK